MRSRTRCYGPTSHRRVGREVKGGKGLTAKVGNMSSATCTCEGGANSACGPTLNDQIGCKKWVRKLGSVPGSLGDVPFVF